MKTTEKTKADVIEGAVKYISKMNEGDIITHDEFRQLINIEIPQIADYKTTHAYLNDLQAFELRYLSYKNEIKNKLLKDHKQTFINVTGKGYVILTPHEQINEGTRVLKFGTKKAIKKALSLYKNIQHDRVPLKERQEINDNIAKAGSINAIINTIKP